MFRNTFGSGLILFALVMILFFGVYFFFLDEDYYLTSMKINAFVLPTLFVGVGLASIIFYKKEKGAVTFREAFRKIFTPMFIGGFLSLTAIFIFLNYVDTDAKQVLNYQFVEQNRLGLEEVYLKEKQALKDPEKIKELERDYQIQMKSFSDEMVQDKDMLTLEHFVKYYFPAILVFYLLVSLFLAVFFRTKRIQS